MPKLLVFAPCEKVIISQDENNPTLIAIITSLTIQATEEDISKAVGEQNQGDAQPLVPMRWSIFTLWTREPSDDGKEFHQTIDIIAPDRGILMSTKHTFSIKEPTRAHRLTVNFGGFPLATAGNYTIRLSLDGQHIADYPLELILAKSSTDRPNAIPASQAKAAP